MKRTIAIVLLLASFAASAFAVSLFRSDQGGTGVGNSAAPAGRYLRSDGASPATFPFSAVAAGGAGACTNQFVRATNDNAAPTCNTVALNIDTSGNYVASVACGSGITGCVAAAPNAAPTLTASVTALGNPSASTGFTVVNGSGTTAMFANAAPALAAVPAGMIRDMAHAQLGGM